MLRIRMLVGSGMLMALFACTGGSSDLAESPTSSPAPASTSTASSATTELEGTWRSVLDADALEQRGFTIKQIQLLGAHDEWSSQQVNEIRVTGNNWMLWQGMDDGEVASTHDYGQISLSHGQMRLDEGPCLLVFQYQLAGDQLDLTLERSTCDEVPGDSVPDFMYAAVFGQPFQRQG